MIKKRKTVAVLVVVLLGLLYAKMASAQNVRFHIAEGNFKGVSQAESQARIIDGLRELERLTEKLTFERVDNSRRAKLRISFGNPSSRGDILAAGHVSVGKNRKDVIISPLCSSFSGEFNRNIETLSMHLGLNAARFRFSTYTKVMREFSIPAYPSQTQMAAIRKTYKVPSNEVKFLPLDLIWMSEKHQHYVALHNAFWAERRQLLLIRDGATNSEEMALAQAAVMENYLALVANKVPMSAAAAQWHYVNNNWIGFPNFINNTGVDPDHPNNGNGDRGDH